LEVIRPPASLRTGANRGVNNISLDPCFAPGGARFLYYIGPSALPLGDLLAELAVQIARTRPGNSVKMLLASPSLAAELHRHPRSRDLPNCFFITRVIEHPLSGALPVRDLRANCDSPILFTSVDASAGLCVTEHAVPCLRVKHAMPRGLLDGAMDEQSRAEDASAPLLYSVRGLAP
jgi:hypothetical protein